MIVVFLLATSNSTTPVRLQTVLLFSFKTIKFADMRCSSKNNSTTRRVPCLTFEFERVYLYDIWLNDLGSLYIGTQSSRA